MRKKIFSLGLFCYTLLSFYQLPTYAEEPAKIAAIYARTGGAAKDNRSSLQGIEIAINELNNNGGVLGKPIKLLVFDHKSTALGAKNAAVEAVNAGVSAIIGSAWSSHSLAVAPVAQENKIPMISNVSTNPKVTKVGDYIFRVCFIDPVQGQAMANFAYHDLNAKKAVIFKKLTSDFSLGLAKMFHENFVKAGGIVQMELGYLQEDTDFTELLKNVKRLKPNVIFLSGHDESGYIVKQAKQLGIKAIPIGGDGIDGVTFMDNGGNAAEEGYYTSHWSPEIDSDLVRHFLQEAEVYDAIEANSALSYDAVHLLADAVKRAGSWDSDKIRDALAATSNFKGVTGNITIDETGNPVKSAVIIKFSKGKTKYLKMTNPR